MSNVNDYSRRSLRSDLRSRFFGALHKTMMGRSLGWLGLVPNPRRNQITTELRAHNWLLYVKDHKANGVRMSGMPASLHLQTTVKCNFRCVMCTRQKNGFKPNSEYPCMDEALLRKVANEGFAYASSVDLTVSGEPLLASNLDESLRLARLYNVALNVTTNGSLLGRPGMLDRLMPSLRTLAVSLDAASPETLEKIRPGARFDEIVAALVQCDRMRKAGPGAAEVRIAAVLMRTNIEELPALVRLAHHVGADKLVAVHMVVVSPALRDESLLNYPDLFNRYRAEAAIVAESLGQTVVLPPPLDPADTSNLRDEEGEPGGPIEGPVRCPFSHHSLYIEADGRARPCCNEDPDVPIVGDVGRQSIRQIWNSDPYLELREGLRTGRLTAYCRRCYIIADEIRVAGRGLMKAGHSA